MSEAGILTPSCLNRVQVHLRRGCFISPSAMSLLGAWGLAVRAAGTHLSFHGDEEVLRYLSRMDVFQSLGVRFTEYFERHPEVGRFIPIKLVNDSNDCKSAVDAICDLVLHQFDKPQQFLPALEWAVNEIIDNILLHSDERGRAVGQRRDHIVSDV